MVNEDSDLVREHPEWVLRPADGSPREWRWQQLLDLTNDDARAQLLERISRLVADTGIDYIKWDHNRDLHEAVHTVTTADGRRLVDAPAVHAHTLAFYRLLDDLRARAPRARDRVVQQRRRARRPRRARPHRPHLDERLQRRPRARQHPALDEPARAGRSSWARHIGPATAHTTHRTVDLGFRMLMALQGHAGLEWDISSCSADGARAADGMDGARARAATAAAHR